MKQAVTSATSTIPPLVNGDNLSIAEFERRYQAHPESKKAELIERTVYVASSVGGFDSHAYPLLSHG